MAATPTTINVAMPGGPRGSVYRLSLTDGTISYLKGIEGCGVPENRRINRFMPNNYYPIDLGFRLNPRNITLSLVIIGSNLADLQNKKAGVTSIFVPADYDSYIEDNQQTLEITNAEGYTYSIVFLTDGVTMTNSVLNREGYIQEVTIRLICPDPLFYWLNPNYTKPLAYALLNGSGTTSLTIAETAANYIDPGLAVFINGGPHYGSGGNGGCTSISIISTYNLGATTGSGYDRKLTTVTPTPNGETWVIDLTYGQKTLYRTSDPSGSRAYIANGTPQNGYLDPYSDLVNFGQVSAFPWQIASSFPLVRTTFSVTYSGASNCAVELVSRPAYLAIAV